MLKPAIFTLPSATAATQRQVPQSAFEGWFLSDEVSLLYLSESKTLILINWKVSSWFHCTEILYHPNE